jgi:phage anti-repressor protein
MKKKSYGMSPDMFNDAVSSTPIPIFSTNEGTKNESQNLLQNKTDVTEGDTTQNELIKVNFDKQTVSARALYTFLDLTERFSKWFKRMISYGLVENIDFTAVSFVICHKQPEDFTSVNNGVYQDIGDYLLTIDAAKHIAMVQRNEKGKQARNYFINIEKLYWKGVYSKNQNPVSSVTPFEKIRNLLVEIEGEMVPRKDYNLLAEKMVALEQKLDLHHLKEEYIERTISKKNRYGTKDFVSRSGSN